MKSHIIENSTSAGLKNMLNSFLEKGDIKEILSTSYTIGASAKGGVIYSVVVIYKPKV